MTGAVTGAGQAGARLGLESGGSAVELMRGKGDVPNDAVRGGGERDELSSTQPVVSEGTGVRQGGRVVRRFGLHEHKWDTTAQVPTESSEQPRGEGSAGRETRGEANPCTRGP